MDAFLNVAGYRFVALDDPAAWRASVHSRAQAHALKGTVLLASEGINLMLAGTDAGVRGFAAWLQAQPPFAGLRLRESRSPDVPFGRLVVKVKREIIRLDRPELRPAAGRAPGVDAPTLARWLDRGCDDHGRPVVTLDTRNAFEVDAGRLRGAIDWRLQRFGDFTAALETHRGELAGRTVVSYCTGGIRCEKAALLMRAMGIELALQLDGGLLDYLSATGGRHFEGHCVVFDRRVALDATLRPTRALPRPADDTRHGDVR